MRFPTGGVVAHQNRAQVGEAARLVAALVSMKPNARTLALNSTGPRVWPGLEGDLRSRILLRCSLRLSLGRASLLVRWWRRQDRLLTFIGTRGSRGESEVCWASAWGPMHCTHQVEQRSFRQVHP